MRKKYLRTATDLYAGIPGCTYEGKEEDEEHLEIMVDILCLILRKRGYRCQTWLWVEDPEYL